MHTLISGSVIHGDQTGRKLGFPTANFDASLAQHIDVDGIYAAKVTYNGRVYGGALYLGPRLNLGEHTRVLEIHLLDFTGDLYGQTLTFTIEKFIRPPEDFTTIEDLKQQLADDIAAVRRALV